MTVRLRALERDDLAFVHRLSNDSQIMSYWFEEPFESLVELRDIYDRHVHDSSERRFVIEEHDGDAAPEAVAAPGVLRRWPLPRRVADERVAGRAPGPVMTPP